MNAETDFSLKNFNTFGIDVKAKQFIEIQTVDELKHVLKRFYTEEIFVLGGGSNMLLTKDIDKTVLYVHNTGISVSHEDKSSIEIDVEAGENWHNLVMWSVNSGFGGLENLALIPGHVGTAPIQNIGAYGVELKDSFVSCKAIHRQTLEEKTFQLEDCKFGYRNSIFKNEIKGQYIITSVSFRLSKKNHSIKTNYGAITDELFKLQIENPKPADVAKVVIKIRQSKLPDPKEIGNSGSFFKNPIIGKTKFEELKKHYPNIPSYPFDENTVKVPAGWLIENAGLKGHREKDAGVHQRQALVLVNYGNATGKEILNLSKKIKETIIDKYDIELETEVNII